VHKVFLLFEIVVENVPASSASAKADHVVSVQLQHASEGSVESYVILALRVKRHFDFADVGGQVNIPPLWRVMRVKRAQITLFHSRAGRLDRYGLQKVVTAAWTTASRFGAATSPDRREDAGGSVGTTDNIPVIDSKQESA